MVLFNNYYAMSFLFLRPLGFILFSGSYLIAFSLKIRLFKSLFLLQFSLVMDIVGANFISFDRGFDN